MKPTTQNSHRTYDNIIKIHNNTKLIILTPEFLRSKHKVKPYMPSFSPNIIKKAKEKIFIDMVISSDSILYEDEAKKKKKSSTPT